MGASCQWNERRPIICQVAVAKKWIHCISVFWICVC